MKKYVINKANLIKNIDMIIKHAAPSRVIAVLKGNGYGLDMVPYAKLLIEQGVDFFAVAEIAEARRLRESDISREILLLAATGVPADADEIIELGLTASIGSLEDASVLDMACTAANKQINAHIKIDSGFGRFGLLPGTEKELVEAVKNLKNVNITGIYTHLSFSFGQDKSVSLKQKEIFEKYVGALEKEGLSFGIKHIANSCAFLRWPEFRMDAVRVGSAFLGRLPVAVDLPLIKIGELKSQIVETKILPKGHNTGYANTYATKRETKIGIVPVGYKDGFGVERQQDTFRFRDVARSMLSAIFAKPQTVMVNGRRVPLIGRIGMYNIIIDLSNADANTGDEVVLQCSSVLLDSSVERSYE